MRKAATGVAAPAIDVRLVIEAGDWGDPQRLEALVRRAVDATAAALSLRSRHGSELGVTFTDDASIRDLNARWRARDGATNVLSFPAFAEIAAADMPPLLGDVVLARETIVREAGLEGKPLDHHLCHLLVHGVLHLLGYDHETEEEAEEMEAVERRVLSALAIPDPYAVTDEDE